MNLIKSLFIGKCEDLTADERTRLGIASGFTGIACNVLLVAVKIVIAVASGSIAVAADAVNNLSDAGAGIITVAGFRLSNRPPDAEHPFGHGRTEYVAGLIVSLLIIGLGISFFKDSIFAIFRPRDVKPGVVTTVIFSSTILIKCLMFLFYRRMGKLIRSSVLKAAAYDSLSDCLGTGIVVLSLVASRFTDFHFDGYAGIITSGMILWAGYGVLRDTVNKLLGEPADAKLVEKLKEIILASPGIDGVHDIMIHNYGENSFYVTAHAEISSEGDRFSAHDILENAEVEVAKKLPVHLLLHGDPYSKKNPEVILWRGRMENEVSMFDSEIKLYDFRLKEGRTGDVVALSFHLLLPHNYGFSEKEVHDELQCRMKNYKADLSLDIKFIRSFI